MQGFRHGLGPYISVPIHPVSLRSPRFAAMRVLKTLLLLAAVAALAYAGYHLYRNVITDYIDNHPAGQEHRPDVFGQ